MTLRLKINLSVAALTLLFVAAVVSLQVTNMRDSVAEETVAANRVAAQLLNRTAWLQGWRRADLLQDVGRRVEQDAVERTISADEDRRLRARLRTHAAAAHAGAVAAVAVPLRKAAAGRGAQNGDLHSAVGGVPTNQIQRAATYSVISKPKRMSVAAGVCQTMNSLLGV